MVDNIKKILSDSKPARWTALLIVAFTMFAGYYLADVMSPLQQMLEEQLHWSADDYGWYTGAYGWFNVFLFFLIFGGIILDKMGVRFTGLMSAMVMVLGAAIKYWAVTTHTLDGQSWTIIWTFPAQVWMAAFGYAIFGVGVEVAGITVSKVIVKWFTGHELALAMGLQLAIARLGTALALSTSLPIARAFGTVSMPILICLLMLCIGLLAFFVYTFNDKRLDKSVAESKLNAESSSSDEEFKIKDIGLILKNKGWWYVSILCALFYSAVFPFLKYATALMINKFGVPESLAGSIPGLLPFGTILLTPVFGNMYDKKGKGASIMIFGSILIIIVHLLFAIPLLNHWIVAIILMIVLGIGFSLVPSAMWPSVPKIIPEKQLGSAYALIFYVQNIVALMFVPALIGWVLDKYCKIGEVMREGQLVSDYNYTLPMILFMSFGLLGLLFAFLLKAEDKKKGYGLQLPNIKK
jgi:MFS family permease